MGYFGRLKDGVSEFHDKAVNVFQAIGKMASGSWSGLFEIAQEYKLFAGSVTKPYQQIASIYQAIKAIADNIPKAELKFRNKRTKEDVDIPALSDLFDSPNPFMSYADFLQACAGFYSLNGEIFIIKQKSIGEVAGTGRKIPAELWPFNPTKFREITEKGQLVAWEYNQQRFELEEVIHIKDWNPYHNFRGLAPTKAITEHIDIDWKSLIYNKIFFDNDASPNVVLTHPKALSPEAVKRLKKEWDLMHKGASKAHRMAVLDGGLKIDSFSVSHKDMEFMEQKRHTREVMLGVWKAPKALFNITEDLNYATFVGQMKIFWLYTLQPILEKLSGGFNRFLINAVDAQIECYFDTSGAPAFQEDFKEKVSLAIQMVEKLHVSPNEANKRLNLGLEEDPRRDEVLVPFNLVRIEDIISSPEPSEDPAPDADAEPDSETDDDEGDDKKAKSFQDRVTKAWHKYLKSHAPRETLFYKTIKSYFWGQRLRVLKAVEEQIGGQKGAKFEFEFMFDWNAEKDLFRRKAQKHISSAASAGLIFAGDLLPMELDPGMTDKLLARVVANRTEKAVTIVETMSKRVNQAIGAGVQEGLTISEIVDQIKDHIKDEYNKAAVRARVIARTETTSAMNSASHEYYKEAGVTQKRWITAGDGEVRDTHQAINGEVKDFGEYFSNGLDYPGGDGPPEEVINCRCIEEPVLD